MIEIAFYLTFQKGRERGTYPSSTGNHGSESTGAWRDRGFPGDNDKAV
jgi:hypothetical protein